MPVGVAQVLQIGSRRSWHITAFEIHAGYGFCRLRLHQAAFKDVTEVNAVPRSRRCGSMGQTESDRAEREEQQDR